MHDENTRYIRPGYVFLLGALPGLMSYSYFYLVGLNPKTTFADRVFSYQTISIFMIVALIACRYIDYARAILFPLSNYFWGNVGALFMSYHLHQSYGLDWDISDWFTRSILAFNNPFPPIIAAQCAFMLSERYDIKLFTSTGRFQLMVKNLYRFAALAFLMWTFEEWYTKFTVTPWILYRPFFDFFWVLFVLPVAIIVMMHVLYRRKLQPHSNV